jgi:crotonobetainyl-CoA:carnitine CoA-transferase CaiB-like acyl-CoA transferase
VPFGLSVADIMCGNHLVQGVLTALLKRAKTGKGVLVEVSLLESVLDIQFEAITSYLNDGGIIQERGDVEGSAHAFLSAPYGVYKTKDSFIALAMGDLLFIGELLGLDFSAYQDKQTWFIKRDEIRTLLSEKLLTENTPHWLKLLGDKGVWCGEVLDYTALDALDFGMPLKQQIKLEDTELTTTRCPIQLDREILTSKKSAPKVGEHNKILLNFLND